MSADARDRPATEAPAETSGDGSPGDGPATLTELERRMEIAAEALDFEAARRLRDRLNLMRGGATAEEAAAADTSGLVRQQPGRMGLGTSQQRLSPPPGWKPPDKPDPMTNGSRRRQRPKRETGGQ